MDWLGDFVVEFLNSASWTVPIQTFIDENCVIFDSEEVVTRSYGCHLERFRFQENKFAYTDCHRTFKELIDSLLTAHLLEFGISTDDFEKFIADGQLEETDPELHKLLVEKLLAADDFLQFKV